MPVTSLTCYYHPRAADTVVLDPEEAAPAPGLKPGPQVRVFDTGAGPLMAWAIYAQRELEPETDARKVAEALRVYAAREETLLAFLRKSHQREARRSAEREVRRRRFAAEEEARHRAAEERARRREAEAAEREGLKREAAAARSRETRLAREGAESVERHVCASGPAERLEAYAFHDGIIVRRALFDPAAQGGSPDTFYLFVPSFPEEPIRRLEGTAHPRGHPQCAPDRRTRNLHDLARLYGEWQAGQREKRRIDALIERYRRALEGAVREFTAPLDDSVGLGEISIGPSDRRLVLQWCDAARPGIADSIRKLLRDRALRDLLFDPVEMDGRRTRRWRPVEVFEQMLSARLAEHAVRILYERCDPVLRGAGRRIVDMSIRQVTGEEPFDHSYDLAYPDAGDPGPGAGRRVLLDVKNTRADPDDPGGYSRLYAKCARPELPDGTAIRIAGTVSEFAHCGSLVDRGFSDGRVRILGETSRADIEDLEARYRLPSLRLSLAHPAREGLLMPPWLFRAPSFMLAQRDKAFAELRHWHQQHPAPADREAMPIPLATAAGISLTDDERGQLTHGLRGFVERLEALPPERRRSLPDLYLTILQEFAGLLSAPRERQERYEPEQYPSVLYLEGDRTAPLGIHDPLQSVSHLLSSLGHLRRYGWDRLAEFRVLEFQQAGVLYARKEERGPSWTLMFTHCANVFACGGRRLVLGREESCPHCRRLSCERCHFCSDGCPASVHDGLLRTAGETAFGDLGSTM